MKYEEFISYKNILYLFRNYIYLINLKNKIKEINGVGRREV